MSVGKKKNIKAIKTKPRSKAIWHNQVCSYKNVPTSTAFYTSLKLKRQCRLQLRLVSFEFCKELGCNLKIPKSSFDLSKEDVKSKKT